MIKYISEDVKNLIIDQSKPLLLEVIGRFQETRRSGANYKSKCPVCNSKDKLSINLTKDIAKCFPCGIGASGAIGYLVKFQGKTFLEAMEWMAEYLNIEITTESTYTHPDHLRPLTNKLSTDFRDAQLRGSGIPEEAQQWITDDGLTLNRYTAGTLDKQGLPTTGGDMLLHYVDLDGHPITFIPPKSQKKRPYIRIRHAIPHPDKQGDPIRYRSPYGGGNHLWVPEHVRLLFKNRQQIETLVVIEGEKKADSLTCRGVPAVGIAGIHNFSISQEMPVEFQRLITECNVQRIVFILDSDYQALGAKLEDNTDHRPRTFLSAVSKYRFYFAAFVHNGFPLTIYMAHGLDTQYKGMDDLLQAHPNLDIHKDLQDALHTHERQGTHIRAIDITSHTDYKLQEIWHLQSPKSFMEYHKATLKTLPKFKLAGHYYKYDSSKEEFGFLHPIEPGEQYWMITENKEGKEELRFDHINIRYFLRKRGIAKMVVRPGVYRFIQIQNNIIQERDAQSIKEFVQNFTEGIDKKEVLRLILTGDDQYLGPKRLLNLYTVQPQRIVPDPDVQYFFFQDSFWKITAKGITSHTHNELPGQIWDNDLIKFSPKLLKPLITLDTIEAETGRKASIAENPIEEVKPSANAAPIDANTRIDIIEYFKATSDFLWRNTAPEEQAEKMEVLMCAMADKILATGYILCSYHKLSKLKAIIAMDAMDNAKQEGGTGKSIWSTMFEHIIPTEVIAADQADLTDDKFLFEGVDERTRLIVFDDARRNFDFGAFKSAITRGITRNAKGIAKHFIGIIKMIINTNFSIKGDDKSYLRRQHIIAFGDYFNENRTPEDEFGHNMFTEWDYDQWNYFYNFMAQCLQLFLKHGLITFASQKDIQRRKLRDYIGENLLDFFESYFYEGSAHINQRWTLQDVQKEVISQYSDLRRWLTPKAFKERIQAYCKYAGFEYNPSRKGQKDIRIRTAGIEFFEIGDEHFDAAAAKLGFDAKPDFK